MQSTKNEQEPNHARTHDTKQQNEVEGERNSYGMGYNISGNPQTTGNYYIPIDKDKSNSLCSVEAATSALQPLSICDRHRMAHEAPNVYYLNRHCYVLLFSQQGHLAKTAAKLKDNLFVLPCGLIFTVNTIC